MRVLLNLKTLKGNPIVHNRYVCPFLCNYYKLPGKFGVSEKYT